MRAPHTVCGDRILYAAPHIRCGSRIQYAAPHIRIRIDGVYQLCGVFQTIFGGSCPPKNTSVKSKGCQPFKKFLQSTKANRRQGKCGQSSQEQVRGVLCVTSHPRIGSQTQGCENEARVSSLTYSLTYLLTCLFTDLLFYLFTYLLAYLHTYFCFLMYLFLFYF